ncbi:MAG TPA: hypothetical protein VIL30_05930 [Ramlibacter sp.]|jgi:hypothetical protein
MRILKMVAMVLAALPILVAMWSVELGKFILKCLLGYRAADPGNLAEEYLEIAQAELAAPKPDERLANIKSIADGLSRGELPNSDLARGLGEHTLQWLMAINSDMLRQVSQAKPDQLREHISGKKTIRGLLAADRESVDAYKQAMARDAEPELERLRRRPKRQEPLLPAFGPIC